MNNNTGILVNNIWTITLNDCNMPVKIDYRPSGCCIFDSPDTSFLSASLQLANSDDATVFLTHNCQYEWQSSENSISCIMSDKRLYGNHNVSIEAEVLFSENEILFKARCSELTAELDSSLKFPILSLKSNTSDRLIIPASFGSTVPLDQDQHFMGAYPSYHMTAEFLLHEKDGTSLLLVNPDKDTCIKRYFANHDLASSTLQFVIESYRDDATETTLRACAKLAIIPPGLEEALSYYRSNQLPNRESCRMAEKRTAKVTTNPAPDLAETVQMWIETRVDDILSDVQWLLDWREKVGAPIGLYVQEWHIPHKDEMFPDYFPAKVSYKELSETLALLTENQIYTFPYLNGRLCDDRSRCWAENNGGAAAVRQNDNKLITEHYVNKYPATVMCPSSTIWQDTLRDVVEHIADIGFSGVYLDNFLAAYPNRCFSDTHGHKPGSSSSWIIGLKECIHKMKSAAKKHNPSFSILSEDSTEVYNEDLELTSLFCGTIVSRWNPKLNMNYHTPAPVFRGLFHDRIHTYCRYLLIYELGHVNEYCIKLAYQVISGGPVGIFFRHHVKLIEGSEIHHDWIKRKISNVKIMTSKNATVITRATMFKQLIGACDVTPFTGEWKLQYMEKMLALHAIMKQQCQESCWLSFDIINCDKIVNFNSEYFLEGFEKLIKQAIHNAVLSSLWKTDSGFIIVMANADDSPSSCTLDLDLSKYCTKQTQSWILKYFNSYHELSGMNHGAGNKCAYCFELEGVDAGYITIDINN